KKLWLRCRPSFRVSLHSASPSLVRLFVVAATRWEMRSLKLFMPSLITPAPSFRANQQVGIHWIWRWLVNISFSVQACRQTISLRILLALLATQTSFFPIGQKVGRQEE